MKFCTKCGHELVDEAVVCINCGCAAGPASTVTTAVTANEEDKVSIGLCVLAYFIPLFGIIYWALKYKETPKRAKATGITAIVSWALGIVFSIILYVAIFTLFPSLLYSFYGFY